MSSRDRRFVAKHRGGPLERAGHAALALWAARCAESVLPFFRRHSRDPRPGKAMEIARAWARGEVSTGTAMKASVAAHAAARSATDPLAVAAARSAGQAVATAHCADHSMGALLYALKIRNLCGQAVERELSRQVARLPRRLRGMVKEGILRRMSPWRADG